MELEWWLWLLLGIALILLELVLPTFIILWLGVCAVLVGVIGSLTQFGPSTEVVLWASLSLVATVAWFICSRANRSDNPPP